MAWPIEPQSADSATVGPQPVQWVGTDAPDGDYGAWVRAPVGSLYAQKATDESWARLWLKAKDDGADDDWTAPGGMGVATQTFSFDEFTDGGGAVGTLVTSLTIPAGAYFQQATLKNVVGFTGDTSATIQVGDGSDVDRYSAGTPSVFTTVAAMTLGTPSGTRIHVAETTVTVTITSAADWGAVTAGSATLVLYYNL